MQTFWFFVEFFILALNSTHMLQHHSNIRCVSDVSGELTFWPREICTKSYISNFLCSYCDWLLQIFLRRISLDLTDEKSILVQVINWCRQATSHWANVDPDPCHHMPSLSHIDIHGTVAMTVFGRPRSSPLWASCFAYTGIPWNVITSKMQHFIVYDIFHQLDWLRLWQKKQCTLRLIVKHKSLASI